MKGDAVTSYYILAGQAVDRQLIIFTCKNMITINFLKLR